MVKKLTILSLLFLLANCTQLTSLLPNDVFRTALSQTGDYLLKKKTGKNSTEHALSAATKKDCSFDIANLSIENPCKEKTVD